MRKWIVVALALALALAVVPLAAAGNGGGGIAKGKAKFCLVGTVVSTLAATETSPATLTVMVKAGTRSARGVTKSVKKWRGTTMTVNIDAKTKIRLVTAEGCVVATLDQLKPDMKVKVRGTIDRTILEAPAASCSLVWLRPPLARRLPIVRPFG